MRKISLLLVIILSLFATTVGAQKQGRITRPLPGGLYCIQDDEGGGYLAFDPASGEFKCIMCEYNYAMSGVGTVAYNGIFVSFNAVGEGYRVFVEINVYDRVGKAAIEVTTAPNSRYSIEPFMEYWGDQDTTDSVMECKIVTPTVPTMPVPIKPGR